jgi:endonuclease-3 related protein
MVGAVLTQSAAWHNVEQAISRLKSAGALTPAAIRSTSQEELARLVYSSGYYNAKARKLKALARYLGERFDDDIDAMSREEPASLRAELLDVHGIGEETADDILLYAAGAPVFVVDAFTRRLVDRLGLAPAKGSYSAYQSLFADALPTDAAMFGEYHALIVAVVKDACRKEPRCPGCCLLEVCPTGKARTVDGGPSTEEDAG